MLVIAYKQQLRQVHKRIYRCFTSKSTTLQNKDPKNRSEEPEPAYDRVTKNAEETIVYSRHPFQCQYGAILPELHLAYEAWGKLNDAKDNVVLLQHGLSANPHARSNLVLKDSSPGWWEKFIGPGLSLDTNKFFVICVNLLGSCYGSTGPSSINPITGKPYGGDFPIVSIGDMVHSQFLLLNMLGIHKVHAVVGASLGGLAAFSSAKQYPQSIDRIVSISAAGNSAPSAIAFRYLQRVALMMDPKWNNGHYYETGIPFDGTRLARKIATLTYRSGPEWDERFKTMKVDDSDNSLPRYRSTEFLIEDYIRHQGESFIKRTKYDPNSIIYLSKAMDIFDIGENHGSMAEGFAQIKCPTLVMGASSDILYPVSKQKDAARYIAQGGNKNVEFYINDGHFGHDTFLLDVDGMGKEMKIVYNGSE
ncbi:homoserine O-acetyltransferase-like isoform X2 [Hydractinia symbiolongicarpus]|uniref:homoserine O-acetyltransferase-like isoform X2 n=1 Tax=Hydractinia symbiolongicarpus TaxID=13093 RepID=UPI00254DC7F9|nr:homoserine O-acetyltransferase-like isoform X2 [Hydractinia symbiolongicarpus]